MSKDKIINDDLLEDDVVESGFEPMTITSNGIVLKSVNYVQPHNSKVHVCPVCDGRGFVPLSFYEGYNNIGLSSSTVITNTNCRSCNGNGIIITE